MDDVSGIRFLTGLGELLRDKEGMLAKFQALDESAKQALAEAKQIREQTEARVAEAKTARDENLQLRGEMLHKLLPREVEVANGAKFLQQMRKDLDARDVSITTRETEMTRRENAAAARENKIVEDEKTVAADKARVAAMKMAYETKLDNIKKAAAG